MIISTLGKLRDKMVLQKTRTRNTNEHGTDGSPGWTKWASTTNPTYSSLGALQKPDWSVALLSASAKGGTVLQDTRNHWSQALSARPSVTYLRHLRSTSVISTWALLLASLSMVPRVQIISSKVLTNCLSIFIPNVSQVRKSRPQKNCA